MQVRQAHKCVLQIRPELSDIKQCAYVAVVGFFNGLFTRSKSRGKMYMNELLEHINIHQVRPENEPPQSLPDMFIHECSGQSCWLVLCRRGGNPPKCRIFYIEEKQGEKGGFPFRRLGFLFFKGKFEKSWHLVGDFGKFQNSCSYLGVGQFSCTECLHGCLSTYLVALSLQRSILLQKGYCL